MNLRLAFDFYVNEKIIEISSFRKFNITILQNLMIQSRLIRYKKIDNRIEQVPPNDMILFINGSISGPKYDQMRYLRMLTNAGWDVYPATILDNEERFIGIIYDD